MRRREVRQPLFADFELPFRPSTLDVRMQRNIDPLPRQPVPQPIHRITAPFPSAYRYHSADPFYPQLPPPYRSPTLQTHAQNGLYAKGLSGHISPLGLTPPASTTISVRPSSTSMRPSPKKRALNCGRNPTSCDECNRRKEGCDREKPCSNCQKRNVTHLCKYNRVELGMDQRQRKRERREAFMKRLIPSSTFIAKVEDPIDSECAISSSEAELSSPIPLPPSTASLERYPSPTKSAYDPPLSHWSVPISDERTSPSDMAGWDEGWDDEERDLMEENEIRGVGSRRGVLGHAAFAVEEESGFFGTSHFGPQNAAQIINRLTSITNGKSEGAHRNLSSIDALRLRSYRDSTLELLDTVPDKRTCDQFVKAFFDSHNADMDLIYQPRFMTWYKRFWGNAVGSQDLRAAMMERIRVDLRSLAILFAILAYGVLLDHQSKTIASTDNLGKQGLEYTSGEEQARELSEREMQSYVWSTTAQAALTAASRICEPSFDTVQAQLLLAMLLVINRRPSEAWSLLRDAVGATHAQGMHIDPERWRMSPLECELRRRLWAQLYALDRSVSLYLGRPHAVVGESTIRLPSNLSDNEIEHNDRKYKAGVFDEMINPHPLSEPTKTTFLILHYKLTNIISEISTRCFGIASKRRYNDVIECEQMLHRFKSSCPKHFRIDCFSADKGYDTEPGYQWIRAQRQSLTSKYHLARISLHRPYILRSFDDGGKVFSGSREACVESAVAEIRLRTELDCFDPLDRFKWMTVASGFNPATIVGIMCLCPYQSTPYGLNHMLGLLEKYVSLEERTVRQDATLEEELTVLRLMIKRIRTEKAKGGRWGSPASQAGSGGFDGSINPSVLDRVPSTSGESSAAAHRASQVNGQYCPHSNDAASNDPHPTLSRSSSDHTSGSTHIPSALRSTLAPELSADSLLDSVISHPETPFLFPKPNSAHPPSSSDLWKMPIPWQDSQSQFPTEVAEWINIMTNDAHSPFSNIMTARTGSAGHGGLGGFEAFMGLGMSGVGTGIGPPVGMDDWDAGTLDGGPISVEDVVPPQAGPRWV